MGERIQLQDLKMIENHESNILNLQAIIEELKSLVKFEQKRNAQLSQEIKQLKATIFSQNFKVKELEESLRNCKENSRIMRENLLGTQGNENMILEIQSKSMKDLLQYGQQNQNIKQKEDILEEDNDDLCGKTMLSIVEEDLNSIVKSAQYQKELDPTVLKTLAKSIVAIKYTSKVINGQGTFKLTNKQKSEMGISSQNSHQVAEDEDQILFLQKESNKNNSILLEKLPPIINFKPKNNFQFKKNKESLLSNYKRNCSSAEIISSCYETPLGKSNSEKASFRLLDDREQIKQQLNQASLQFLVLEEKQEELKSQNELEEQNHQIEDEYKSILNLNEELVHNDNHCQQILIPQEKDEEIQNCEKLVDDIPKESKESAASSQEGNSPKNSTDSDMFFPFTHFFVLGCQRSDLKEFDNQPDVDRVLIPGKLLYSYSNRKGRDGQPDPFDLIKEQVSEYAFPFGVEAKKMKVSQDDTQPIQTMILPPTKHGLHDKFFFFKIRSQETFKQVRAEQQQNHLLKILNPNKLLFFTCLQVKDYFATDPQKQNRDSEEPASSSKKSTFWRHQKIFCFVSYFPLYDLFTKLLANIQDQIKVDRQFKLMQSGENLNYLSSIDSDYVNQFISTNLEAYLKQWQTIELSTLSRDYYFPLDNQESITFHLPHSSHLRSSQFSWSLIGPLQCLSLSNFLFILFALLQEQHVIFCSQNLCLLTKAIACFENLIMPFQWPFPIIYTLSENLIGLLGSPQPIILGLNKGSKYLLNHDLIQSHPDHIFILLDEGTILTNNNQYLKNYKDNKPSLFLKSKLSEIYSQIRHDNLAAERVLNQKQFLQIYQTAAYKKSMPNPKFYSSSEHQGYCSQIQQIVHQTLQDKIVSLVPKQPIFCKDKKFLDYTFIRDTILKASLEEDKHFLSTFCSISSQIFLFFCEDFYNLVDEGDQD